MQGRVLAAYATVSVVWGSTYLAIRIGVRHIPPALLGGIRFLTAGCVLLAVALALGGRLPRRARDWVTAATVGILLLSIGNGLVIWAELYVESGTAAILVVTGALWIAVFDALIPGSEARPTWRQFLALVIGLGGTVLLVGGIGAVEGSGVAPLIALLAAAGSWALGSVYSKRRPVECGHYIHSALQMCFGGGVLLLVGALRGEFAAWSFSLPGLGAIAYLIVFGSIVGYTSYVYLLKCAQPALVGTTGYVNTVVAVLLGWAVLQEEVTVRTFVAMAVILGAVVWVRRAERSVRDTV